MDSLNLAVARSHAEELENWKSTLENDPAAKGELQAAVKPEPAPAPKTQRPPRIELVPKPPSREPAKTDKPVIREPAKQPRTQPDEAKDYHRQKWEESRPAQRQPQKTRRSNPAPAPKREVRTPKKVDTPPQKSSGRNN